MKKDMIVKMGTSEDIGQVLQNVGKYAFAAATLQKISQPKEGLFVLLATAIAAKVQAAKKAVMKDGMIF